MRIGALSKAAGLPVGTVKFYLRSGLLHPGRATSPTQAQYDDTHLDRLRLIRALLEVGRVPLSGIQRVLDAVDLPTQDPAENVRLVRDALAPAAEPVDEDELAAVRRLVADLGWHVAPGSAWLEPLARSLAALRSVGVEVSPATLRVYAEAAMHAGRHERLLVEDAAPGRRATLAASSVLVDALLAALRRLAVEHQSADHATVPSPRMSLPGA